MLEKILLDKAHPKKKVAQPNHFLLSSEASPYLFPETQFLSIFYFLMKIIIMIVIDACEMGFFFQFLILNRMSFRENKQ